jgi:hypothetical protein
VREFPIFEFRHDHVRRFHSPGPVGEIPGSRYVWMSVMLSYRVETPTLTGRDLMIAAFRER